MIVDSKAEEERGLLYLGVGLVPKCEAQILESIFYDFLESVLLDWIKEVPYRHIQRESIEWAVKIPNFVTKTNLRFFDPSQMLHRIKTNMELSDWLLLLKPFWISVYSKLLIGCYSLQPFWIFTESLGCWLEAGIEKHFSKMASTRGNKSWSKNCFLCQTCPIRFDFDLINWIKIIFRAKWTQKNDSFKIHENLNWPLAKKFVMRDFFEN